MSIRSRLKRLERELERRAKPPEKPTPVALSRRFLESLPRSVLDAITDACERQEAGVPVDWNGPNPYDELDLAEALKVTLRESLAAGCWCGPPGPLGPFEVSRPAAEPATAQQAAPAAQPAAAERP